MKVLKRWRILAPALISVLLLPACSGGGSASSGGASAGSVGGAPTQVVLWHMEQPPNRVKVFQGLIDAFNKAHSDVQVTQQVQDWNQIYAKIPAAIQSQTQPDILFAIPDFASYVNSTGAAQPVTALVKQLDSKHHFLAAAKDPYYRNDQYLAVPLYGFGQVLWYRKDLFAKAGIMTAPTTWDELQADAAKLTHGSQYGIALPAGKNLATDQTVYSLMTTNHAESIYSNDNTISFNNERTVQTFELYNKLLQYSPPDSANYGWSEPQAAFNNGTAAMAIEKGQYTSPFTKESGRPARDLGCARIPQPSGGQPGSIYYSNGAMILTKDQKKVAAAGEFLSYLLEPENYGTFLNAEPGLFLPLTQDGQTSSTFWSNPVVAQYKQCVQLMVSQSQYGKLFGFTNGQYQDSVGKISGQNLIAQSIQQMFVSHLAPANAVKWGSDVMQKAITR